MRSPRGQWQRGRRLRRLMLMICATTAAGCGGADPKVGRPFPDASVPYPQKDGGWALHVDVPTSRPPDSADAAPAALIDASLAPTDAGGPIILPQDAGCSVKATRLDRRPAEIVFVLDRSTAMAEATGDGSSRWALSDKAIRDSVSATQEAIAWGLSVFPKPAGTSDCCQMPPDEKPTVEVLPSSLAAASIASVLQATSPTGTGAPTARAILQAAEVLVDAGTSTSKYLVLVTGGAPTCAADSLCGGSFSPDYARTKSAVSQIARVLGISIAVVVVALPPSNNSTQPNEVQQFFADLGYLGGMANTSQGQLAYYAAASATELTRAFGTITAQTRSCSFVLPGQAKTASEGVVQVSGNRISRDTSHQDGWDYGDDGTSVVLYGKPCDGVRNAKTTPDVQFLSSCPNIIIE